MPLLLGETQTQRRRSGVLEQLVHGHADRRAVLQGLAVVLLRRAGGVAELDASRALLQWQAKVALGAGVKPLAAEERTHFTSLG